MSEADCGPAKADSNVEKHSDFPTTGEGLQVRFVEDKQFCFSAKKDDEGAITQRLDLYAGGSRAPANLEAAKLNGIELRFAILRKAYLRKAQLQKADLYQADLTEASMRGVDLRGAAFSRTKLYAADLSNAQLGELPPSEDAADSQPSHDPRSKSLAQEQLAGTDLTSASLPEHIDFTSALKGVEDASKNARTLFISLLASCLFVWLVIGTTTDTGLLLREGNAKLPFVGIEVPIIGFYIVAPGLLLSVYTYFHLYLSMLWRKIAALPAYLPDGRAVDDSVYPWLLISLARKHIWLLKSNRYRVGYNFDDPSGHGAADKRGYRKAEEHDENDAPPALRLKQVLSVALAYQLVPATLWLVFARALAVHDAVLSALHVALFVTACFLGLWFRELTTRELSCGHDPRWLVLARASRLWYQLQRGEQGPEPAGERAHPPSHNRPDVWRPIACSTALLTLLLPTWVIFVAITGDAGELSKYTEQLPPIFRVRTRLVLERGSTLKSRPDGWREAVEAFEQASAELHATTNPDPQAKAPVKTPAQKRDTADAQLRRLVRGRDPSLGDVGSLNKNLRYANMERAFLPYWKLSGVDLSGASLRFTSLVRAELVETKLRGTDLSGAYLASANLEGAKMAGAALNSAVLSYARLVGAVLRNADLTGVTFRGADLNSADLSGARLEATDFIGARGLSCHQLRTASCADTTRFNETENLRREDCCTAEPESPNRNTISASQVADHAPPRKKP